MCDDWPKGQSIDVVAHELMHAEIHQRVGYLASLLEYSHLV